MRFEDGKRRHILLHQLITGSRYIDHVNHNGLDNRRENLRPANASENQGNKRRRVNGTSQYKGVSWNKQKNCWRAQIRRNGNTRHLGLFADEAAAARVYDAEARMVFGPFACLNFPMPGESAAHGTGNLDATAAVPGGDRLPAAGMSAYLGVVWAKDKFKWQARVASGGKQHHLGFYASDIEAALAYDAAAPGIFEARARVNFPHGLPAELADLMLEQQEAGRVAAAERRQHRNAAISAYLSSREPETRICEICGGEYQTTVVRATKYCGDQCNEIARNRRRREETARKLREAVPGTGICCECGDEYPVTSERSQYCSSRCRSRAYRERKQAAAA